jgi:hypothetical protein
MSDRIEIVPGSPQWRAWHDYRVRHRLTTDLMDRCAALGKLWREAQEWPDETSEGTADSADEAASQAAEAMPLSKDTQPPREPPPFTWCNNIEKARLIDYLVGTGLTAELAEVELMEMSIGGLQQLTIVAMRQQRQPAQANFTAAYDPFAKL